jgi:hypothetical protein
MHIMTVDGWKQLEPRECAPAIGTFKSVPRSVNAMSLSSRCDDYERNVRRYINEEIGEEAIYRCWQAPIYGAFGEVIR